MKFIHETFYTHTLILMLADLFIRVLKLRSEAEKGEHRIEIKMRGL
jgi:hypothetical protein